MRPPAPVLAHLQGTALDLPVDLQLVLLVGAAAVVSTATWMVRRDAVEQAPPPRRDPPASALLARAADSVVVVVGARAVGLTALAGLLWLAVAGPVGADRSALPRLVTVVIVGGVLVSSSLVGPWYHAVDPLRPLAAGLRRLAATEPRPVPDLAARWVAAAGVVVAVGLGLTALDSTAAVAAAVLAYVTGHVVAGARYGAEWFDRAESLSVLSAVTGSVAPVGRRADGRVGLRDPVVETIRVSLGPGATAVVAAVVGAALWEATSEAATTEPGGLSSVPLTWLGLMGTVLLVAALVRLACPRPYLASSLLPLAAAYGLVLMGVPLLLDGRIALSQLTDPTGAGPAPPGLAAAGVVMPVAPAVVAAVQTVVFVGCHCLAIAVAHRTSLARFDLRGSRAVMFPVRALVLASVVVGLWLPTLAG